MTRRLSSSPNYVSLWIDHPAVGCGWRTYVVVYRGRIRMRLVCVATMEAINLTRVEFEAAQPKQPLFYRSRLEARMRANAADFAASKSVLQKAITAIKEAA